MLCLIWPHFTIWWICLSLTNTLNIFSFIIRLLLSFIPLSLIVFNSIFWWSKNHVIYNIQRYNVLKLHRWVIGCQRILVTRVSFTLKKGRLERWSERIILLHWLKWIGSYLFTKNMRKWHISLPFVKANIKKLESSSSSSSTLHHHQHLLVCCCIIIILNHFPCSP